MKLSKLILIVLIFNGVIFHDSLFSQHITNTMGVAGLFRIKDNSTTYFTLTQSNGYVDLTKSLRLASTTDLNTGVIYKGTSRFIHNYEKSGSLGNNTFIGLNSGNFTMGTSTFGDGSNNTGVGYNTLNKLTSGSNNTALGTWALELNTSGYNNIAIGTFALNANTSGAYNTAIGPEALSSNTIGTNNVAIGTFSLLANISGTNNIGIGNTSLQKNTIGWDNIGIGKLSLEDNIDGSKNVAVGNTALSSCTGDNNTSIGHNSGGNLTTGNNNIVLGYNSQSSSGTVSNQVTLGNSSITSLRCNVQTITSLSDARDKKNINDLSLGLDFIMQLKPRQFNWDRREWYENNSSDGSRTEQTPTAGFIAQELDSAQNEFSAEWLNLVLKDNPEKWEATYGNLLPVMVKAIQELKNEYDELKQANMRLAQEISELRSIEVRLAELEAKLMKQDVVKEIKSAEK